MLLQILNQIFMLICPIKVVLLSLLHKGLIFLMLASHFFTKFSVIGHKPISMPTNSVIFF